MQQFFSLGWQLSDGLTSIQIIFIVLFAVFAFCLILLTFGFWTYRKQLKKIKKIDQNLEIIYRYPLEEAINRLEKINVHNNFAFDQFYKLVRIKYLTVLEETFNVAAKQFLDGLERKEFTKLTYRAIVKLILIDQAVDKAKTDFDTLYKLLNDFFTYEYELRDVMIELKNQVDLIKTNYEANQNNTYQFPEKVFGEYLGYIHKFINLIHNYLVAGDYQTAFDKLLKILTWTLKVNEESVVYPKIRQFLADDLPNEMSQIERDWATDSLTLNRAKNRFKFLKERTFNESKVAFDAINSLDFKRAKVSIENIQKEIYAFKSELVYEEEIKSFFKFKGNEIKATIELIMLWVDQLAAEQTEEYKQAEKAIYDSLVKPAQRIQKNLVKVDGINERDLETLKKQFFTDLEKIEQNIYLLNLVKTTNSLIEEEFLNYLSMSFEIKANLIVMSNVLKDADSWLKPYQVKTFNDDYFQLYKQLNKDEVNNLEQFSIKYGADLQKNSLFTRLNNMKTYSYKLKSTLVYEYQLYYLASAILPLLEFGQNEGKIHYVYQEMVKDIEQKNYEQAIDQFINNINSVYYQL